MALIGYASRRTSAGEEPWSRWSGACSIRADVRQRDMTAFNHVVTGGGEGVAQVDGLSLLSRDWWPGDVLVQRYWSRCRSRDVSLAGGSLQPGGWRPVALSTGGDSVDLAVSSCQ